jgi:hypothetical protein
MANTSTAGGAGQKKRDEDEPEREGVAQLPVEE